MSSPIVPLFDQARPRFPELYLQCARCLHVTTNAEACRRRYNTNRCGDCGGNLVEYKNTVPRP